MKRHLKWWRILGGDCFLRSFLLVLFCVPVFSTHRTLKRWDFSSSYVCLPTSFIKGLCFSSVNTYSLAYISAIIQENVGITFFFSFSFFPFKFISVAGLFLLSLLHFCHRFQPRSSHFCKTMRYFHTCKTLSKVESQMSHLHVYVFCFFFFSAGRSLQLSKPKVLQWSWDSLCSCMQTSSFLKRVGISKYVAASVSGIKAFAVKSNNDPCTDVCSLSHTWP